MPTILKIIDDAIAQLNRPLDDYERRFGWNEQLQMEWLATLASLRESAASETLSSHPYRNVNFGRLLDNQGVFGGALCEWLCAVSIALRNSNE